MRWIPIVLGIGLIAVGAVFTFQGYGTLKGSFMTGSRMWLWIGIACLVAGVVVLVVTFVADRSS
ncbi:MAG: hypothetical protein E6G54_00950 [Actinobacteria bacterium]|nr:MAG: hypothetical protein E6G54_00950 [Actinomycetota bacterium]